MNFNEVIAHLATQRLGDGSRVHPNDDVNLCQSSNDVFPTAIQLAAALAIEDELVPGLERLRKALDAKSDEFWPVVKTGRTHLQDATPVRLGQEFRGYAGPGRGVDPSHPRRSDESSARSRWAGPRSVPASTVTREFAMRVCRRVSRLTGLPIRETHNHFDAQSTLDALIAAHGAIRAVAPACGRSPPTSG